MAALAGASPELLKSSGIGVDARARLQQQAAEQLQETTARFDVDEVMIHPVAGARPEDPLDEVPGRTRTLELLAGELLG